MRRLRIFAGLFLALTASAQAQIAQGGTYTLDQSVIAGGGTSAGAGNSLYSLTGSIGQAIVDTSSASPFTIKSGFFTADAPLAPTAASVTISGRAITSTGRGIRNVVVVMTDSNGTIRAATTTALGYYSFANVAVGETYVITARGKRYTFAQPTQVLNINDDNNEINFIGSPASSFRESL